MKSKKVINLLDKFPNGKHQGKLLKEIIDTDPKHYDWLLSNPNPVFTLSFESLDYYRSMNDKIIPANPFMLY